MSIKKTLIFGLISIHLLLTFHSLNAQDLGNSPYSQIGIGDIRNQAFSHQAGMAGIGAAFDLPFQINNVNPALLSRVRRTILDVGLTGQLKFLNEGDLSQRDFGAGLTHVALAFPIAPKMTSAIGFQPYSSVSYQNTFVQDVIDSDFRADVTYRGKGGLTNVFFNNSIELIGRKNFRPDTLKNRLSLGLKINYVFGAVIDEAITRLDGGANQSNYEIAFKKRTTFSDFVFEPGLAYTRNFGKKYRLNLGAVYSIGKDLNAKRFIAVDRRFNDTNIDSDTIVGNERGRVSLASRAILGFSFEKIDLQSTLPKWALAADFTLQDWGEFRNFETTTALSQRYTIAVGGLYIPNFTSVQKGFWQRSIYRLGLRYERNPFTVNDQEVEDYAITAGISVPFGRSSTTINLSIAAGQRGTLKNNLIREQYLQAQFGVTINDTWFIKRRFD